MTESGALPVPINPESLGAPRGFSHGMLAPAGGRLLFVAGQIAVDRDGRLVADDFPRQFARALENVLAVVREAGGGPEHVVRLTVYATDKRRYLESLAAVGEGYRRVMGRRYPAMALVEVAGLLEPGALVEIEGTAVVP
ncbi:MAG TPA: RidA family protein [Thermoanaerobaculia bacterium]